MKELKVEDVVRVFNDCFRETENTELVSGGDEPIYLPAEGTQPAKIVSTLDYFSSALHEISHWCIAGKERRKLVDYGYWYEPDGRSEIQQAEFEKVEIKPQALEWLFTQACGLRFRISADNLNNPNAPVSEQFKRDIVMQARKYAKEGVNNRAMQFLSALRTHYMASEAQPVDAVFSLDKL